MNLQNNTIKVLLLCLTIFSINQTELIAQNTNTKTYSTQTISMNTKLLHQEADDFLKTLDPNLQYNQTKAIEQALNGDFTSLIEVRNSRNVAIPLIDGVKAKYITEKMRIYYPANLRENEKLPCLIYLHGGCWIFGSINSCSRFCMELVKNHRVIVVALDYSLAPTNPYPYALNDIMQCTDYLFEHAQELNIDADNISLGGDSAGGNMAIVAAVQRKQKGKKNYASLIAFYPVTKAWNDESISWKTYEKNSGLEGILMDIGNKAYIGEDDKENPEISPAMYKDKDLKELPKTLIVAADRDILKDQGREFYERILKLGVDARYVLLPYTYHLFITVKGQQEAFNTSVKLSGDFLNEY
ncbi:MAG: alpha/beta hydrolase [Bacteroidales bacterium]|nr:alpha/beta hydrolase [Bacteroidales bacterium]